MTKKYEIELEAIARIPIQDEVTNFILEYGVKVLAVEIDTGVEKELPIGEAKVTRILIREAINRHEDIFALFDATNEIADFCFLVSDLLRTRLPN